MNILRRGFDKFYDFIRGPVFDLTDDDPETAHYLFVNSLKFLHIMKLDKIILDFSGNSRDAFSISNAAGFNKNGDIHPNVLKYLGFDRNVIGTVTCDSYEGNPRSRMKRFPSTNSLVNWMGLPGIGAREVARKMEGYGLHGVPITINIMSTPGKEGRELLNDLEESVWLTRNLPNVDRYELNISCPNTCDEKRSLDNRERYLSQLSGMLDAVCNNKLELQSIYLKVSPDLDEKGVEGIIKVSEGFPVAGFTTTNTTTYHDPSYITNDVGKGGASGDALYERSLQVQRLFNFKIGVEQKIIGCGGINSFKRLQDRIDFGAKEIQIFTPLIFNGPRLLREIRTGRNFSD